MLVLSRQRDESIIIGDNIIVTVVEIRGDKVRLGIDAPGEIPVHRKEVYEAIQRESYNSFKGFLNTEDFIGAYNIFYENGGSFGIREEINKMVYGLNPQRGLE